LKSLKAYDKNKEGQISVNEVGKQTCEASADLREEAAANLASLLVKLEAFSVAWRD